MPISLKIAYLGGGSRDWARKLMSDLALCPDLTGEVATPGRPSQQ